MHHPLAEPVFAAFDFFLARFIVEGKSALTRSKATVLTAEALRHGLQMLGEGDDHAAGFNEKMRRQFAGEPEAVREILAHAVWLWTMPPTSFRQEKKMQDVLNLIAANDPEKSPALRPEMFPEGFGAVGTHYKRDKYNAIRLNLQVIDFLYQKRKDGLLTDAADARQWIERICLALKYGETDAEYPLEPAAFTRSLPMENTLLYLCRPEHYERVVSEGHKQRIVRLFQYLAEGEPEFAAANLDEKIFRIRQHLAIQLRQPDFDFYDHPDVSRFWYRNARPYPEDEAGGELLELHEPPPPPYGERPGAERFEPERFVAPRLYTRADALRELFLPEIDFDRIQRALRQKRNIVLQGPPGVGKTFVAGRVARAMLGSDDARYLEWVQFHQSYGYEDFVQGIRPGGEGTGSDFAVRPGIFYTFCQRAQRDPDSPYFFIIDEINRGNLGKIFGELLLLIESDKRGPAHRLRLTYSAPDEHFFIPENLYLIGTMNTADRSLALVDFALRRRFAFLTLTPQFGDALRQHLLARGASAPFVDRVFQAISLVNDLIARDPGLGEGFQLGHSYLAQAPRLNAPGAPAEQEWWQDVVELELAPLLQEYWFDRPGQAQELAQRLLEASR